MADPQDLKGVLDASGASTAVKAQAWDAYQKAGSQADFKSSFDKLDLPEASKASLWDLKFSAETAPAGAAAPAPLAPAPNPETLPGGAMALWQQPNDEPLPNVSPVAPASSQSIPPPLSLSLGKPPVSPAITSRNQSWEAAKGPSLALPPEGPIQPVPNIPPDTTGAIRAGIPDYLGSVLADIRHGTSGTLPGQVLAALGAPGISHGQPEGVGEMIGGPLVGPVEAAHGVGTMMAPTGSSSNVTADQRLAGFNEAVGGALKTVAPALAMNPEFLVGLAKYGVGQAAISKAAQSMGASPVLAEAIANAILFYPAAKEALGMMAGVHGEAYEGPEGSGKAVSAFGGKVRGGYVTTPEDGTTVAAQVGGKTFKTTFGGKPETGGGLPDQEPIIGAPGSVAAAPEAGPPTPEPSPRPAVAPADVERVSQGILALPEAERPAAIVKAHDELSADLQQQGKIVVNGKLEIIKNEGQADKLAQNLLNQAIAHGEQVQSSQPAPSPAQGAPAAAAPQVQSSQPQQTAAPPQPAPAQATTPSPMGAIGRFPKPQGNAPTEWPENHPLGNPPGTWMNRGDIDGAVDRFKDHPVLGPASRFLKEFQEETDDHSDGWSSWKAPSHAAHKLMGLIYSHMMQRMGAYPAVPEATAAQVQSTMGPIKSFMTKRGTAAGMKMPALELPTATKAPAPAPQPKSAKSSKLPEGWAVTKTRKRTAPFDLTEDGQYVGSYDTEEQAIQSAARMDSAPIPGGFQKGETVYHNGEPVKVVRDGSITMAAAMPLGPGGKFVAGPWGGHRVEMVNVKHADGRIGPVIPEDLTRVGEIKKELAKGAPAELNLADEEKTAGFPGPDFETKDFKVIRSGAGKYRVVRKDGSKGNFGETDGLASAAEKMRAAQKANENLFNPRGKPKEPTSYKVGIPEDGKFSYNSLRFPTREAAEAWGNNLAMRWMNPAVDKREIHESDEPVNTDKNGELLPEKPEAQPANNPLGPILTNGGRGAKLPNQPKTEEPEMKEPARYANGEPVNVGDKVQYKGDDWTVTHVDSGGQMANIGNENETLWGIDVNQLDLYKASMNSPDREEKSEEFDSYDDMKDAVHEGDRVYFQTGAAREMSGVVESFDDDDRSVDVKTDDSSIPSWAPIKPLTEKLPGRIITTVAWELVRTKPMGDIIQGETGAVSGEAGRLPGEADGRIGPVIPEDLTREGEKSQSAKTSQPAKTAETKYKFGNTQANIPDESEAGKALNAARSRISDSDVAGSGKDVGDGGNHVTVRYGIQGDDTQGIRDYLAAQKPFEATLGKTEKFPPSEHSDGAAVIIAPVQSSDLSRMNGELGKHGDFTEPSFKQYRPHATIAYVKPEKADRYVGMDVTHGKKFTVDQVMISHKDGSAEVVKLGGAPAKAPLGAIGKMPKGRGQPRIESKEDFVSRTLQGRTVTDTARAAAEKQYDALVKQGTIQPPPEPTPQEQIGVNALVDAIYKKLSAGEPLGNITELNKMGEQYLGGSRTSGAWTPKDLFDAMEAGVNKLLLDVGEGLLHRDADTAIGQLRDLQNRLTSQGTRTEEQIKAQQFSTPPAEAYVVARVANLKPSDVVLEPSAGNGGLAVWPKSIGATVYTNEISPRRREMLKAVGFEGTTAVDGELLNALLPSDVRPTVVLMNPPFSSSTQKSHEVKQNLARYGFNHVDQALQRLADGGRLVTILSGGRDGFQASEGANLKSGEAGAWFTKIAQRYNVRANIRVDGKEYQKYGTTMATRIIVIDKDGPTPGRTNLAQGERPNWDSVIQGDAKTLEEAYAALKPVEASRPESVATDIQSRPGESPGGSAAGSGVGLSGKSGGRGVRGTSGGSGQTPGRAGSPAGSGEPSATPASSEPSGGPEAIRSGGQSAAEQPAQSGSAPSPTPSADHGNDQQRVAQPGLDLERAEAQQEREQEDTSAYVSYQPSLKGAKHPGSIVETKAMATVAMPPLTYKPNLPESAIGKAPDYKAAKLSAVQLEAIAIAGMQNDIVLPGGFRASALIGDGTGVGKGREGAGILWDNWRKGRKRLVWMTKSKDLMKAAQEDFVNLGAPELAKGMLDLGKLKVQAPINHEGILFTTYRLFNGKEKANASDKEQLTRAGQIDKWLRGNDDGDGGYLLMDESHNLKNAVVSQGGGKASQIGVLTKDFLQKMPALRTVSLSATAATDVMNLGYLDRLGLWGPGTPFPSGFSQFAAEISHGGMSAMELIARDLKAQGKYLSRTLSYKGVKYVDDESTTHILNPEQEKTWNSACDAWDLVLNSMKGTIQDVTNGGTRQMAHATSQFYGTQQRFFNLLLTSMKIPTCVRLAEEALADGKCVAITLINTNEAAQNRERDRLAAADDDEEVIPDYDFGPGKMLSDLVRAAYPVQQYQDDVNDNGEPIKTPVYQTDADGNPTRIPVLNPDAVRARDELIAKLERELHMPQNPLDELIDLLGGPSKVAELTGRKQRLDPVSGKLVNRGGAGVAQDKVNLTEMANFQAGKKLVAILSSAADTGISLHSSLDAKNQRQRIVITLQVGWSADKAMQMNGRFNRTNQAGPPEYRLLKSNMGGESRFISSIARRMESLEALSKGQTKTNAGTEGMSKVNFETEQGESAAAAFYNRLMRHDAVPGAVTRQGEPMDGMDILDSMGVLDAKGEVPQAERTNVTRLLNRILARPTNVHNPVFEYYQDIFNSVVAQAERDGTLDTGVKRIPGDEFNIGESRALSADPKTGAQTFYYPITAQVRLKPMPFGEMEKVYDKTKERGDHPRILKDAKTGDLALAVDAHPIIHADGTQQRAMHLMKPGNRMPQKVAVDSDHWVALDKKQHEEVSNAEEAEKRELENVERLTKRLVGHENDNYADYYKRDLKNAKDDLKVAERRAIDARKALRETDVVSLAKDDWSKQHDEAPTHTSREHHLVGGYVTRFWNAIRDAAGHPMGVYSAQDTKSGQRVVGVEIPANHIKRLLAQLTGGKSTVNAEQIIPDVLNNGTSYDLEGGIRVRRGRVSRESVVQFVTSSPDVQRFLKDKGVIYEAGMQPIYYLPTERSFGGDYTKAQGILDKVLKQYPVQVDNTPADQTDDGSGTTLHSEIIPGATYAARAVSGLFKKDLAPALSQLRTNLGTALGEIRHLVTPRADVPEATLTSMMKLTGEKEKRTFLLDQALDAAEKGFNKVPEGRQVDFIDRMKAGEDQPTSEEKALAEFLSGTDEDTYLRVVDTQVRTLGPRAQKFWSALSTASKENFVHNLDDFRSANWEEGKEPTPAEQIAAKIADNVLSYKENHYRVLWKDIPPAPLQPGEEEEEVSEEATAAPSAAKARGVSRSRRPLQGSKGFMKRSTLASMSEGIERGGVPWSYNPVTLFKMAQADAERYITAQNMWQDAKEQGARIFVKRGARAPDGFSKVENDRIGNVSFRAASGEGYVEAGNWYLRDDYARLMNNYLADDWIRKYAAGRGVLATKNTLTQWRLGFSLFHGMTESVSAMASDFGLGARELVNSVRGGGMPSFLRGVKDLGTAAAAPVTRYQLGKDVLSYVTEPEKFLATPRGKKFQAEYPLVRQYIDDMFHGGMRLNLHPDERTHALAQLQQAWANRDWGDNPIGTSWKLGLHGIRTGLEKSFALMFNHWIPLLKVGSFFREHAFNLADYAPELAAGTMTRAQVARKGVDSVEDLFGQVNWDKFFWGSTFKTANQILFRAAQWAAGNYRLSKNALSGQSLEIAKSARYVYSKFNSKSQAPPGGSYVPRLDPNFAKILGLFMVWTMGNMLVQLAATRQLPKDAYDLFAARIGGLDAHGKPKRITMPAVVMKDAMSLWFHGPRAYLSAKTSDLVSGLWHVLTNRNFNDDMVRNPDDPALTQAWDATKEVAGAPISIQNILRAHKSGEGVANTALGEAGFQPPPRGFGWTPAEQKAYQVLRDREGPRTPEAIQELDEYTSRKESGQLTGAEANRARVADRRTFLARTFRNNDINFDDALPIWREMDDAEKATNKRELIAKYNNEVRRDPDKRPQLRQQLNDAIAPTASRPFFLPKKSASSSAPI